MNTDKQTVTDSRNVAGVDWAEEKAAGWAGKDIHGCYTTDPKAVVSEAELKASCEAQLYRSQLDRAMDQAGVDAWPKSDPFIAERESDNAKIDAAQVEYDQEVE